MKQNKELVDVLEKERTLSRNEFKTLLTTKDEETTTYLYERARSVAQRIFGNEIYIRGLIEFSNYCKQNCFYCGLRKDNQAVERYRLDKDEILECCIEGYRLGFRTFVLQSGEDNYYTKERMVDIIQSIRTRFSDCAITLSVGEKDNDTYQAYYNAGANRFLLRHETITPIHYRQLHPEGMELDHRKKCLCQLKDIGFQTGSGIMVGSPYQTLDMIIDDLYFLAELQPQMIGIGPYLPSHDTPFKDQLPGSLEMTVRLLAVLRFMHPHVLLPATTALATIDPKGREMGILAGANVVMPNLSPLHSRKKYQLYNNKACMGDEGAHCIWSLNKKLEKIGYTLSKQRGDYSRKEVG
jgi:biotin synthase